MAEGALLTAQLAGLHLGSTQQAAPASNQALAGNQGSNLLKLLQGGQKQPGPVQNGFQPFLGSPDQQQGQAAPAAPPPPPLPAQHLPEQGLSSLFGAGGGSIWSSEAGSSGAAQPTSSLGSGGLWGGTPAGWLAGQQQQFGNSQPLSPRHQPQPQSPRQQPPPQQHQQQRQQQPLGMQQPQPALQQQGPGVPPHPHAPLQPARPPYQPPLHFGPQQHLGPPQHPGLHPAASPLSGGAPPGPPHHPQHLGHPAYLLPQHPPGQQPQRPVMPYTPLSAFLQPGGAPLPHHPPPPQHLHQLQPGQQHPPPPGVPPGGWGPGALFAGLPAVQQLQQQQHSQQQHSQQQHSQQQQLQQQPPQQHQQQQGMPFPQLFPAQRQPSPPLSAPAGHQQPGATSLLEDMLRAAVSQQAMGAQPASPPPLGAERSRDGEVLPPSSAGRLQQGGLGRKPGTQHVAKTQQGRENRCVAMWKPCSCAPVEGDIVALCCVQHPASGQLAVSQYRMPCLSSNRAQLGGCDGPPARRARPSCRHGGAGRGAGAAGGLADAHPRCGRTAWLMAGAAVATALLVSTCSLWSFTGGWRCLLLLYGSPAHSLGLHASCPMCT